MLESAEDARKRANRTVGALRLVNEVTAGPLIEAVARGESSATIGISPVDIAAATGMSGRLNDAVLIDTLDSAGHFAAARACRIFVALGFSLSAKPELEFDPTSNGVGHVVRRIRITQLELGFAVAQPADLAPHGQLLQAVVLPAAHLWRHRAEGARLLQLYERKALAIVARHAEHGADGCRLMWRELGAAEPLNHSHLNQLAVALRSRGFDVEATETPQQLRLRW